MKKTPSSNDEFHDSLMGEDDLGVVLRAHFYFEEILEALIQELIPFPKHIPRPRFEQRALLACSLGLDESIFKPLKELGELRNSFGHQLGKQFTQGLSQKFYQSFTQGDQQVIITGYNLTRAKMTDLPPFEHLSAKDLFVVSAISLHKMLVVSYLDAKGKPLK
jgi:hypothetical protein